MRILAVNRFFGDAQTPTGRMLENVVKELIARGHQVTVVVSSIGYVRNSAFSAASSPLGNASASAFNIQHGYSTIWQWQGGPRLVNWGWFWLAALARLVFGRYDACLLLTDPPFLPLAARIAGLFRGQRKVYWWSMDLYPEALHAAGMLNEQSILYRLLRWLNGLGISGLSGTICLGPRQLKRLQAYREFNPPVVVVPPWDLRLIQRIPAGDNRVLTRLGWQGKKIALYGGNLGEGHLFGEFIAGAKFLLDQEPGNWLFVFAVRGAGKVALIGEATGLRNVVIADYFPESDTSHLLSAATVHLISMKPGWDGVIVPSKLYGVLQTGAPVLFIGPSEADTAVEIKRLDCGLCLPPGAGGREVGDALKQLADRPGRNHAPDASGPSKVAAFITGEHAK